MILGGARRSEGYCSKATRQAQPAVAALQFGDKVAERMNALLGKND